LMIFGSGTVSTRTSSLPYQHNALIELVLNSRSSHNLCGGIPWAQHGPSLRYCPY
jgi:hypothetical protein